MHKTIFIHFLPSFWNFGIIYFIKNYLNLTFLGLLHLP